MNFGIQGGDSVISGEFPKSGKYFKCIMGLSHTSFTLIKISFRKCLAPQTSKLIFELLKQQNFHKVKHVCEKISKVENAEPSNKIFLTETSQMCLRYHCLFWEILIIYWLPLGFVWRKCQLLNEFSDSTKRSGQVCLTKPLNRHKGTTRLWKFPFELILLSNLIRAIYS